MAKNASDEKTTSSTTPAAPAAAAPAPQFVYFFGGGAAEGDRTMRDLLGGKGANLAEMTRAGLPVPAGFTVSTEACTAYYAGGRQVPGAIDEEMERNLARLEELADKRLGSTDRPLLVSVRSGAKFSMPGMMDTILNLGLNDEAVEGLKARTANGRFAFDSYRRFIQMFGNVVLEIPKEAFEEEFDGGQGAPRRGARHRARRDRRCASVVEPLQGGCRSARAAEPFPLDPRLPAPHGARRGVPLVAEPAREGVPPHLRHPRRHRHRRQRAGDGVRQHRRPLGDRRRLHPQPGDRSRRVLRRVPDQRAGRGRGGGHPHAAADPRARAGDAARLRGAAHHHQAPGAALPRRAGLRVHHRGREALHAADAQRQAHRARRGGDRHRPGRGRGDRAEPTPCAWSTPTR